MHNNNYSEFVLLLLLFLTSTINAQTDSCSKNPCKNGGKCIVQDRHVNFYGYSCYCTDGWTGSNCDIRSSNNNFISGGGGGISGGGSSSGDSSSSNNFGGNSNSGGSSNSGGNSGNSGNSGGSGSGGSLIDKFTKPPKYVDPCQPNPCYPNGRCESSFDRKSYRCKCNDGNIGPNCQSRSFSNIQPKMKPKKSILGYILGTVIPFLVVVAIIGLCIYCCCCRKGDSSSGGFMSKFSQLPAQFGVNKSKQTYSQPPGQFEDPDEAFKAYPPPPK